MRMGANKIGIQQEAASLSAIFPFLKVNDASVIQIGGGNNSGNF